MLGEIAGDVIGSVHEGAGTKTKDFPLFVSESTFTDDVSCQGSVPQSIIAFLESNSYEDAVRNAISLGGDADTMACIAGGIAEAFYGGVPEDIRNRILGLLDVRLRGVVEEFVERFDCRGNRRCT